MTVKNHNPNLSLKEFSSESGSVLVSVVIPTRNRPVEVCHAVRSVLAQTYKNIEILIVVDGPDSLTLNALHQFVGSAVHVIENLENVGLAEARNVGIRRAQGKWVALLDDDDEWFPSKIAKQLSAAEELGSGYAIISSRYIEVTDELKRIVPEKLPLQTKNFSEYIYCDRGFLQPSTLFVSRALFLDIPFTKGLQIEDTDWLLRALSISSTQLIVLEEALSIYNNQRGEQRLGTIGRWELTYVWGIENRSLFTERSFPVFMVMECVTKARYNKSSWRVLLHLVLAGWFLGAFTFESFGYFVLYVVFSGAQRRQMRLLTRRLVFRRGVGICA